MYVCMRDCRVQDSLTLIRTESSQMKIHTYVTCIFHGIASLYVFIFHNSIISLM
jgi:hypothetical protein